MSKRETIKAIKEAKLFGEVAVLASSKDKNYGPGDLITTKLPISLTTKTPKESNIRLIHNGEVIQQNHGKTLERTVSEPGYYRVEVYVGGKLWIVSNPIYVESNPAVA